MGCYAPLQGIFPTQGLNPGILHCRQILYQLSHKGNPWTVARQAPLSMEFPRQEYWSGLPFPSTGIFPTQGSNPGLLHCRQILYQLSHKGSPLYIEVNSKWFKDLDMRHDTIKFLEENMGKIFSDINHSNIFLDDSPKAKEIKAKINE